MAAINPPAFLPGTDPNPANNPQHPALLFRRAFAGVLSEGVANFNSGADLKVSQSAAPAMSVVVAKGGVYILGDDFGDQGIYFAYNDADATVNLDASDPTNPRKDLIVARVKDAQAGQPGDVWLLDKVTGTPSSSAVEPALPATAYKLAVVNVPANASSITNANIVDSRAFAGSLALVRYGVRLARIAAQSIPTGATTAINWNSEEDDPYDFHSGSSSDIVIPAGGQGLYSLAFSGSFDVSNAGNRRRVEVHVDGTTVVALSNTPLTGFDTSVAVSTQEYLNEGATVNAWVVHDKGSACDFKSPRFRMIRVAT